MGSSTEEIRTLALVGHAGSGKTTLVEALLAATGTIARPGSVTEGTTVGDNDPASIKQQRSVALACAPFMHEGVKVNLLDPGPVATKMRRQAFPGEDAATLPTPDDVAPWFLGLAEAACTRHGEIVRVAAERPPNLT